jgi:molybdopterin biosynthesis enzyme MoaB
MHSAILAVSSSTAAGDGEDLSGPALADAAAAAGARSLAWEAKRPACAGLSKRTARWVRPGRWR